LARLIRERPVFVNLGGSFVYKPAIVRQTGLSGDFRLKIALESSISGIRSSLLCRDRRCRLGEPWIRGTMPQLNP
jgi:hypothetical protein